MAKKVTKYEAEDGTLFDTAKDADNHSEARRRALQLSEAIENLTIYGNIDSDTLLEALKDKDSKLTQAVLQLHA